MSTKVTLLVGGVRSQDVVRVGLQVLDYLRIYHPVVMLAGAMDVSVVAI